MLIRRKGRCGVFAGSSVWSTSERLVVEVLTIGAIQVHFPFLPFPFLIYGFQKGADLHFFLIFQVFTSPSAYEQNGLQSSGAGWNATHKNRLVRISGADGEERKQRSEIGARQTDADAAALIPPQHIAIVAREARYRHRHHVQVAGPDRRSGCG